MKKITKVFPFLLFVLVFTSCEKDFIELVPFSEATVENFYKTQSDFENAVAATYDVLQDSRLYSGRFEYVLEVRSDNGVFNDPATETGDPFNIDKFQETTNSPYVSGPYAALFQGVQRANIVLSRIDKVGFDESLKTRYKAEVRFIRALCYFHLVQLYGAVPLITEELTLTEIRKLTRIPISQIYSDLIEQDLIFASQNLPLTYPSSQTGRVTSMASLGLLAKVYLTQGKYQLSKTTLETVINSGKYALLPNINSVFSATNEYNAEVLFAVRFRKGEGDEGRSLSFDYTQNRTVSPNIQNAYEATDLRAPLVQYVTSTPGRQVPRKHFDQLSASVNTGLDIIVLRYADILLMYAEVNNELDYQSNPSGEAFTALNAVRTRAGLNPYTNLELKDQVDFRTAVLQERRLELALEFSRWYDLLRTNTAIATLKDQGINIDQCDLLYPIPQSEIDVFNNPIQFPQNCE